MSSLILRPFSSDITISDLNLKKINFMPISINDISSLQLGLVILILLIVIGIVLFSSLSMEHRDANGGNVSTSSKEDSGKGGGKNNNNDDNDNLKRLKDMAAYRQMVKKQYRENKKKEKFIEMEVPENIFEPDLFLLNFQPDKILEPRPAYGGAAMGPSNYLRANLNYKK